ncbi:MAG: UbiH/UbiF/VisC/COQ6 family ubiquinone biosynthesis hydroxylase [Gammaproteobacteria bacterium]|jgi:2-octaprenylphenol hydroxylase|nr:UbiH/UbiF/VisC/COQ6 family ubiquinone biosynthesis hydroxylase [Gammaproteobacteria bacterium]|tara:strand:+ start:3470 stop:4720 length:1251 start_codon:yes stop_codon:yes gene_type:complete
MTKAKEIDFDLIIVGGGMVGASLACLLAETNLHIALVDRSLFDSSSKPFNDTELNFDARVSAITSASRKIFEDIGAWDKVKQVRCCAYTKMQVWDADGTGSIDFSADDINQTELGFIVENSVTLSCLYDTLQRFDNVELIAPSEVENMQSIQSADHAQTRLQLADGSYLTAKLVVGADGANSKVRELGNFATKEWDYGHNAIVCTVCTEHGHKNTALQRFIDTGPLAFLPLATGDGGSDQHYCSIVWSCTPERAEQLFSLSDDEFTTELSSCIEHRLGRVEQTSERFSFPLRQRHAIDYVNGNVVLVGDAAHTIHPLAGQGVNLGLLDAKVLAEEIITALGNGRNYYEPSLLRRYQRKRIGHNLGMMYLMEGFKYLFGEQTLPLRWLRNIGMSGADNLPLVKNQLARKAMGLDWNN